MSSVKYLSIKKIKKENGTTAHLHGAVVGTVCGRDDALGYQRKRMLLSASIPCPLCPLQLVTAMPVTLRFALSPPDCDLQ